MKKIKEIIRQAEPLRDRPHLFRGLRILQLATIMIIAVLEIIETITYIGQFKDTKPLSYYLSPATFKLCGIKLLYHIVIALTLISTTYYFLRFSHRWYHGPYQTDIFIDFTLFYLWIVAGITNIYPLLVGMKWQCLDNAFGLNVDFLLRILCEGYIFSTILGWTMVIEFCVTTILYLKLWKTRDWWDNDLEGGLEKENSDEDALNEGFGSMNSMNSTNENSTPHHSELSLGPKFQVDNNYNV